MTNKTKTDLLQDRNTDETGTNGVWDADTDNVLQTKIYNNLQNFKKEILKELMNRVLSKVKGMKTINKKNYFNAETYITFFDLHDIIINLLKEKNNKKNIGEIMLKVGTLFSGITVI